MKFIFATFTNSSFMNSDRIAKQAKTFNIFDEIIQYTELDIPEFINKHQSFINSHPEGYGYYIWKPKIILDTLMKMEDDSILLYCDAGMYLNINGINRLHEYLENLKHTDIVTFSTNNYKTKCYVKMDAIMNYYPEFITECVETNCVYAGVMIIKKCNKTINLINDWLMLCENYNFLDSSRSMYNNEPVHFIGNDKDNGLFNLCLEKHKISYKVFPDETNIYVNEKQIHHIYIDVNTIDWSSLNDKPFQYRRLTSKFAYNNEMLSGGYTTEIVKQEKAYFLGHNGLGDNITYIGAIRFLLQYYKTIYFLCKDIYKENVQLLMNDTRVQCIDFKPKDEMNQCIEFNECAKIILNAYNSDNNIDLFVCGLHRQYLNSKITHPNLLNYKKNDKHYTVNYDFIKVFYNDIHLDLSVYYEYFNINDSDMSVGYYNKIKAYNIIFLHTKSSTNEITLYHVINQYINNKEYIIICSNKNIYPEEHPYHDTANLYINILIANFITIIKNATEIHVIDSCFSCMVMPMNVTNQLKATKVNIYNRNE